MNEEKAISLGEFRWISPKEWMLCILEIKAGPFSGNMLAVARNHEALKVDVLFLGQLLDKIRGRSGRY